LAETTTVNYGWTKPDPGASANTWGTTLNATTDKVDAKVYANEQGLAPIGAVTMYAGAVAPANWLLCNGVTLPRAAPYDKLFAVLGTAFNVGTVAADSFMLPDLRQKYPLGVNTGNALGTTGGAFPVTLTTANMPSHTHGASESPHIHTATQVAHTHPDPGHTHGVTDPGHVHGGTMRQGSGFFALSAQAPLIGASSTDSAVTGISIQAAATGLQAAQPAITVNATAPAITVAAAGSGTPFNVVPPFVALNYIVRYI